MYDKGRLENNAHWMADASWTLDQAHLYLLQIALEYGEHNWETCAKFGEKGSIENDCSCGWGPIEYYLRQLEKRGEEQERVLIAGYDSPDNNAWTRANYGLPPEPGDPGYEEANK